MVSVSRQRLLNKLDGVLGYSLFSTHRILHGAHIRPFALCQELGIPLDYARGIASLPRYLLEGIARGETLILFPGYTVDQTNLLLIYLAKLRQCKLIVDVADIPYLQYQFFQGTPSSKSISDFARLVHLADILLYSTRALQRETAELLDVTYKHNYVVENASDPQHFKFSALPDRKVILFVGGYIPARGVDELIDAYRILRMRGHDCLLRLVGFGYPQSLREPGVEVIQDVYYDQIPSIFAGSYVFVIPHRPNLYMKIAAPIKLFDAMASGRPIVSTPCDETAAVIQKEKCGVITGIGPSSMADGIEHLLTDKAAAEEMGRRGRIAIEQRNSWKIRARELSKIIQDNE